MIRRITIALTLLIPVILEAQNIRDTTMSLHMFSFHVTGQLPAGDLSVKYGAGGGIGGSYLWKTSSNWIIKPDFSYYSSKNFKDTTMFDMLMDENGQIISIYGEYADVQAYMRGFYAGVQVGKVLPVFGPNTNSGLMLLGSAGFLQHKTYLYQEQKDVPLLNGDYQKGWDHLSNGLALNQFIGYLHLDNDQPINFYVGFDFYQAFTRNRRDWNFDLRGPDPELKYDFMFGIRLGWIFPVNKKSTGTYYYF